MGFANDIGAGQLSFFDNNTRMTSLEYRFPDGDLILLGSQYFLQIAWNLLTFDEEFQEFPVGNLLQEPANLEDSKWVEQCFEK